MKRLAVIAITVASTFAVNAAAAYWWLDSHFEAYPADEGVIVLKRTGSTPNLTRTKDGLIVLTKKQAAECRDGGGCAVFSLREMDAALREAIAHMRNPGSDT